MVEANAPTPIPPKAGLEESKHSDDKTALELRKLTADTRKAEYEAGRLDRSEWLRLFGAILPGITVIISVAGLLISLNTQAAQQRRADMIRHEDQFTAVVRDFGSSSELSQLAAIVTLDQYWRDERFRDRVQDLLLAAVASVPSSEARHLIQLQFLEHADSTSLSRLADHNRSLTGRIREMATRGEYVARYTPVDSMRPVGDSLVLATYEDLGWNIATLIGTINRMKQVDGVDLSNVVFSRLQVDVLNDTVALFSRIDQVKLAPGVVMRRVNLTGAFLAGMFIDSATFLGVSLDSANLSDAYITRSRFGEGSSLAGFRTWITHATPGMRLYDNSLTDFLPARHDLRGAVWSSCTVEADAFYPDLSYHPVDAKLSQYMWLRRTNWIIRQKPPITLGNHTVISFPLIGDSQSELPDLPVHPSPTD